MSPDVAYCYEDQKVEEAAKIMERRRVRRLPVMDRNRCLVGLVSLGDLAVRSRNGPLTSEVLEHVCEHNPVTARDGNGHPNEWQNR